jgi:hypothetical protein
MTAAWPRHGRRASPPSASGPAPQALGPPHKNPRGRFTPNPRSLGLPSAAATRRGGEGGGEHEEKEEESTRRRGRTPPRSFTAPAPERRHRRSRAPCTAPTHRHRPATASSLSPFSPAGEHLCRRPFSSPCCRREPRAADEPSVAIPSTLPLSCAGARHAA